jgi:hypothetical protein
MTISDILKEIRCRRVSYGKNDTFKIPLQWKNISGTNWAFINKEHAKMIAAATGKRLGPGKTIAPHFIHGSEHEFLGIGKNGLSLIKWHGQGTYALRHERRDFDNPIKLPSLIDLGQKLKPHEEFENRPSEMMPEDFYM